MADQAQSLTLHPLVVINISDHYTRSRAQSPAGSSAPRVYGAVLGEQVGRRVELANSFELKIARSSSGADVPDLEYLRMRLEQYKKTFPKYDMLGWYSTASEVQPGDMEMQMQLSEANEGLLYLTLDPSALAGRELPITIYESEVHLVDDAPTTRYVKAAYKVDSIESERIAVDHVAHILPSGDSNASSALAQHLGGQYTAMSMLSERVEVILRYLKAVDAGTVPMDHALMRQIKSLCTQLPALDSPAFRDEFLQDHANTLLITYLGTITKGTGTISEVIDKFSTAYDKHSRRRGMF